MLKELIFVILLSFTIKGSAQIQLLENKGQYPKNYKFVGNIPSGRVFFEPTKLTYEFTNFDHSHRHDKSSHEDLRHESGGEYVQGHSYNMNFVGVSDKVKILGKGEGKTSHNYFVGAKENWVTGVKEHKAVVYQNLYDDIDFHYYKYGNTVKYDFVLKPEADPKVIQFDIEGLDDHYLDAGGNLNLVTSVGTITETRPRAYQIIDNERVEILCSFSLKGSRLSFDVLDNYDPCYELVIDPTLIFSTYSGSTADNWGNTATFDDDSNLYSGGITNHYNGGSFPATSGAFQTTTQGFWDVAIIKYDSTGSNALYATYLGGSQTEVPQSLIVNEFGELFILGATGSSNFPTKNAFQNTFRGGSNIEPLGTGADNLLFPNGADIFISKLSATGSNLVSSTFIGGTDNDGLTSVGQSLTNNYGDQSRGDIFIRKNGNVMITSKTVSIDFPLQNAFQPFYAGGLADAVIFELTSNLNSLVFSSYLGGSGMDAAYTVKEDIIGNIFLGGGTDSNDIDSNVNFSEDSFGSVDGWLAKIENNTYLLDTGFYIGTSAYDQLYFIDLDADDNVFTYGQTAGVFPIVGNVFNSGNGQFVQKYSSDIDDLLLSTEFGSSRNEPDISPTAFLVNDCDNIYLSGWGGSTNSVDPSYNGGNTRGMPITSDAFQSSTSGNDFYLITLSDDLQNLLYGTYLGGSQSSTHVDGGTSRFDKRGIVYHAVCAGCGGFSDFPATEDAFSLTNNSDTRCNNAAFKFDLATLRARIQTNSISFDNPGITDICFPDPIIFQNLSIGGTEYVWDFGDGSVLTTSDTTFLSYKYNGSGTYTVTLQAIDPNTCVGSDLMQTTVRVFEPTFAVIDDTEICEGTPFQLWAIGGTNYFWTSQDSVFQSSERNPTINPKESMTYFVNIRDGNGCQVTDTVHIDVVPGVDINFNLTKTTDCFSRTRLQLLNFTEGGDTYFWDLGDGSSSDFNEFSHSYEEDGIYDIRFTATNDFCVYEESAQVDIITIKVPNVFTPNTDASNDMFEIVAGDREVDLKILNRWGRLVYENDDYKNEWTAEGEPAGVYYYEAIIKDETTCKGWVQVLK